MPGHQIGASFVLDWWSRGRRPAHDRRIRVHPELTNAVQGRARAARTALAVVACLALWSLTIAMPAGAQEDGTPTSDATQETVDLGATGGDATEPEGTVADAEPDETAPADAVADGGASTPSADDEAQSDERLLNLIIIGLLVLAAVIAIATLLFWKSTAPDDTDSDSEKAEPADGQAAGGGAVDSRDPAAIEADDAPLPPAERAPVAPPSAAASGAAAAAAASALADSEPDETPKPSTSRRRVMASFPSSPLGDVAHASAAAGLSDPPPAPVGPGDTVGEADISTLGAGASPGRPSVAPPDAVRPAPQRGGAYRIPPPDELPAQPDRPFADAENRPPVERAADRAPSAPRQVPPAAEAPSDSAIVTTSKPAAGDPESEEGPAVVVRRRRRDRPEGPWGEGVGGGHRPDVPPLPPPDPEDQGYQRGVRVVRPEDSAPSEGD